MDNTPSAKNTQVSPSGENPRIRFSPKPSDGRKRNSARKRFGFTMYVSKDLTLAPLLEKVEEDPIGGEREVNVAAGS